MSETHNPSSSQGQAIFTTFGNTGKDNRKRPKSSRSSRSDRRCVQAEETMAADKLAEQATTLMKVKWICAILIVSTVVNAATFGALAHAIIKRIDHNEQVTATLQSQFTSAGEFIALNDIRTRISEMESNFTDIVYPAIERLSQLEDLTVEDRRIVDTYSSKLVEQDEFLLSANETLHTQDIRILQLETDQRIIQDTNVNNSDSIALLQVMTKNQTMKQSLLEMDLQTMEKTVRNQTDKIEEVRTDADANNVTLFSYNLKLEELESRQNLHELHTANQSVRLVDLEFSRQSSLERILEMEQIANVTQQTLYDVNVRLTNVTDGLTCFLGDWSMFSPCSHTCGNGTKYRTRSCQNTTGENRERYPRTETDIIACIEQECPVHQIGFTAWNPTMDVDGIMRFTTATNNYGSGYSTSTGIFTCSHSGLYYFSAAFIKPQDVISSFDYCRIYQNTTTYTMRMASTYLFPTDDVANTQSFETSVFLVVHLSLGDQVYITCTLTVSYESYFVGFMIQSD